MSHVHGQEKNDAGIYNTIEMIDLMKRGCVRTVPTAPPFSQFDIFRKIMLVRSGVLFYTRHTMHTSVPAMQYDKAWTGVELADWEVKNRFRSTILKQNNQNP